MPPKTLIFIGAVYIDTILTVPHFPPEDTKLRASSLSRRRGGNTANTLEVLTQLVHPETHSLHLCSVLPDKTSDAVQFVKESLPDVDVDKYSVFKEGEMEAASSYIIMSEGTGSRTIVSFNRIGEMGVCDFETQIAGLEGLADEEGEEVWVHFEGRTPDVTLQCVRYLRGLERMRKGRIRISVECEKPERVGMLDVAAEADVVVYSRLWAEKNGFDSAEVFLRSQLSETREDALLCCTWGSEGATAVQKASDSLEANIWASATSWHPEDHSLRPIDSIGAGDTFIAGLMYGMTSRPEWSLEQKLQYANELAGQKVYQDGFKGLGEKMKSSKSLQTT